MAYIDGSTPARGRIASVRKTLASERRLQLLQKGDELAVQPAIGTWKLHLYILHTTGHSLILLSAFAQLALLQWAALQAILAAGARSTAASTS